jgi:hypothetical protein
MSSSSSYSSSEFDLDDQVPYGLEDFSLYDGLDQDDEDFYYGSYDEEDEGESFLYLLKSSSALAKLSVTELPEENKRDVTAAFSSSILLLTEVSRLSFN